MNDNIKSIIQYEKCTYCNGKGHTYSGKMPSNINDQYVIEEKYKCLYCDGSGLLPISRD